MAQSDPLVYDGFHLVRNSPLGGEASEELLHRVQLVQKIPCRGGDGSVGRKLFASDKAPRVRVWCGARKLAEYHAWIGFGEESVLPIHGPR